MDESCHPNSSISTAPSAKAAVEKQSRKNSIEIFLAFRRITRNNSTTQHVVSMEKAMRQFLESIKPAGHGLSRRHQSLGQAAFNMRDYPRI
jgi:hypothetical protein